MTSIDAVLGPNATQAIIFGNSLRVKHISIYQLLRDSSDHNTSVRRQALAFERCQIPINGSCTRNERQCEPTLRVSRVRTIPMTWV